MFFGFITQKWQAEISIAIPILSYSYPNWDKIQATFSCKWHVKVI